MSGARQSSCSVFVGNIPYDASEVQLTNIFKRIGPVESFRLVVDRDTGKPKGYGFCEFRDPQSAISAIRNLNNFDLNGRSLRVNERGSGDAKWDQDAGSEHEHKIGGPNEAPTQPKPEAAMKTIESAISLSGQPQLYEVINSMQELIGKNPEQAKTILKHNPILAQALLQVMLELGVSDATAVRAVLQPVTPIIPAQQRPLINPMNPIGAPPMVPMANVPIVPPNFGQQGAMPFIPFPAGAPPGYPNQFPGPVPPGAGNPGVNPANMQGFPPHIVSQLLNLSAKDLEAFDPTQRQMIQTFQQQVRQAPMYMPPPR